MLCSQCQGDSKVSNVVCHGYVVWRTRTCDKCGHTWSTSEMEDEPLEPISTTRERLRKERAHARG